MVLNIAHRGASAHYPENTLKAIENAIRMGADMVEVDLKISKDGHIIVFHDETVNRLTERHGYVKDMTLKELKALNAGKDQKIPTLNEVIEVIKDRVGIMLDISSGSYAESLIEKIHHYRIRDNLLLCGVHEPLKMIKALDPTLGIAPSFQTATHEDLLQAVAMEASVFNVYYPSLTSALVTEAHKHGLKVTAWVVNNE